jgi:hypothetical protein
MLRHLQYLSICFALCLLDMTLSAMAAQPVDVWLLSGQSNMQGNAKLADIPADVTREIKHAYFWNGQEFEPLILGKTKTSTRADEFGPEIGFALELATAERPIYLIKHSASGMPLHHGWDGSKWVGGEPTPKRVNFYPGTSASDPNRGTLYVGMLTKFKAGLAKLKADGKEPRMCGVLWMQGEADAKAEESAKAYDASLKRFRERLAVDLQVDPALPLIFGQVLPHEPANARFTHRTEIRAAMAAVDAKSGAASSDKAIHMVSTDGFGMQNDTVHYNAAGQLQLGRTFAKKALERLK